MQVVPSTAARFSGPMALRASTSCWEMGRALYRSPLVASTQTLSEVFSGVFSWAKAGQAPSSRTDRMTYFMASSEGGGAPRLPPYSTETGSCVDARTSQALPPFLLRLIQQLRQIFGRHFPLPTKTSVH